MAARFVAAIDHGTSSTRCIDTRADGVAAWHGAVDRTLGLAGSALDTVAAPSR